jgi:hypothetical protein
MSIRLTRVESFWPWFSTKENQPLTHNSWCNGIHSNTEAKKNKIMPPTTQEANDPHLISLSHSISISPSNASYMYEIIFWPWFCKLS